MAKLLVNRAHSRGLAAGQKNASELGSSARRTAGTTSQSPRSAERYRECDAYTSVYGNRVIEVECTDYSTAIYQRACTARGADMSIVLRDRLLVPAGAPGYRYEQC